MPLLHALYVPSLLYVIYMFIVLICVQIPYMQRHVVLLCCVLYS